MQKRWYLPGIEKFVELIRKGTMMIHISYNLRLFGDWRLSDDSRKLVFCYLANDVMQNSRKKGKDFPHEYGNNDPNAFATPPCREFSFLTRSEVFARRLLRHAPHLPRRPEGAFINTSDAAGRRLPRAACLKHAAGGSRGGRFSQHGGRPGGPQCVEGALRRGEVLPAHEAAAVAHLRRRRPRRGGQSMATKVSKSFENESSAKTKMEDRILDRGRNDDKIEDEARDRHRSDAIEDEQRGAIAMDGGGGVTWARSMCRRPLTPPALRAPPLVAAACSFARGGYRRDALCRFGHLRCKSKASNVALSQRICETPCRGFRVAERRNGCAGRYSDVQGKGLWLGGRPLTWLSCARLE